jgi:hypothetical protein
MWSILLSLVVALVAVQQVLVLVKVAVAVAVVYLLDILDLLLEQPIT